MKNLRNLKGVEALNRKEQKSINGGTEPWCGHCFCDIPPWPIWVYACGSSQNSACLNACEGV